MSSEVGLWYEDMEAAPAVALEKVGPSTAYVASEEPLPVGTRLKLRAPGDLSIPLTVIRVYEKVGTGERRAGMWVQAAELSGKAAAFWEELVTGADPTIPEQAELQGEPVDKARSTQIMSTDEVQATVAKMAAEDNLPDD